MVVLESGERNLEHRKMGAKEPCQFFWVASKMCLRRINLEGSSSGRGFQSAFLHLWCVR